VNDILTLRLFLCITVTHICPPIFAFVRNNHVLRNNKGNCP